MGATGSSMMLMPLAAPLVKAGVDLAGFWRDVGVAPSDLADPKARLDGSLILAAWDAAVSQTGDENFGLRAAQSYEPGMFHVLDYLVANAATLGEALDEGRARLRLLHDLAVIERIDNGDTCVLELKSAGGSVLPRAQSDFFLACLVLVGRMLSGVDAAPNRVCLPHTPPLDGSLARAIFRCDIAYRGEQTAVEFPDFYLDQPCRKADPNLMRVVAEHADLLLEQLPQGEPLVARVRGKITEHLRTNPSLEVVARGLGMSTRTLRRRLEELDTSFQQVRDTLRVDIARRLLRDSRLSLDDVAEAVGFSSTQTFARSFRRAVGESPARYRRAAAVG